MRKLGLVAVVGLLAAMVGARVSDAATASPFAGSWTSIDPVDGSTQHLYVQGGANLQVQYVDEYGTVCVNVGAPTVVFTATLIANASGNEMVARFNNGRCGSTLVLSAASGFAWIFEYDPGTDTLWGAINDGPSTWHRD